ncbi:MAG: hypothetical protein KBH81_02250 [Phycisphaerae bacterium]|nr:hypothetical protein [Phycisphaerae bacterium]HOO15825.1 hypothetical protein [Phycisphaerae bacterium]HPC20940.1 hypothetical protein [Phycisphaerae bacterium]HRS27052.1 hypothetical protein [Phycisphaerae bacterium]HRT40814.1 hypothetical protein [Phycisphaerae bacterium]
MCHDTEVYKEVIFADVFLRHCEVRRYTIEKLVFALQCVHPRLQMRRGEAVHMEEHVYDGKLTGFTL